MTSVRERKTTEGVQLFSPKHISGVVLGKTQLPLVVEGALSPSKIPTEKSAQFAIMIAVNNRIEAITTPFRLQMNNKTFTQQRVFSGLVPEEAFRAGNNTIEAFAVSTQK